jgi:uncharacterized protein YdeI (BOF family)
MKKQIIIAMMALLVAMPVGYGQQMSKKEARAKAKAEKKAARAAAEAANVEMIKGLIEQRHFVLEATFLANKQGQRISVSPTLNFIMIEKDKATFQFGGGSQMGYNGVGGVTMDGRVQNYEYTTDKKGIIHLDFQIATSLGTIFVSMTIMPQTSHADANITGTGGKKLYYTGDIVPPEKSRVYKGSSII